MNQEKFGKLIKDIRKKNNLTQKDLADKYGISYQAVSKWENGLNMPDISLIKQISKDFNIPIDNLLEGNNKTNKTKTIFIITISISILIIASLIIININQKDNNFEFKKLKSSCNDFNISGSIAYNNNKSAIYISGIEYCGGDNTDVYKEISCNLYETSGNFDKLISHCSSNSENNITLEDYLKNISVSVDNYSKMCKEYSNNSLYLEINATKADNKTIIYKIPLSFDEEC